MMCVKLSMDSGLNSSLASTTESGRITPITTASPKHKEVRAFCNLICEFTFRLIHSYSLQ